MPEQKTSQNKTFYAVLIGINAYDKKIHRCNPLSGCINDVMAISDFFEEFCASQKEKINWEPRYYLAPREEDMPLLKENGLMQGNDQIADRKKEFYYNPTRDNIIKAFSHFDAASEKKGDLCLLYYSGHGSYVLTSQVNVFSDYEPSGELQTIICADEPRKDLLDKELGYLIANVMKGKKPIIEDNRIKKGVHFLSIMDCCHSGSNTRDEGITLTARKGKRSSTKFDYENGGVHGFTKEGNCFYEPFEEGQEKVKPYIGLKHARYVNLSAARDSESAYELALSMSPDTEIDHGIFTYNLIRVLKKNGVKISYKELIDRVKIEVKNWVGNQFPVLGKTHTEDEQLLFLGKDFANPKREYKVTFRRKPVEEWWMNAGSLHGIVPSSKEQKTIIKVTNGKSVWDAEVKEVRVTESILEGAITMADPDSTNLKATIEEMAFPRIKVGFGDKLPPEMREKIKLAWKKADMDYAVQAKKGEDYMFEINPIKNKNGSESFILTRNKGDKDTPLFVRHANPATFLADMEKVARFHSVITMENPDPDTQIPPGNIKIEIGKLEGVKFDKSNIEEIDKQHEYVFYDFNEKKEVLLRYKRVGNKYQQPAIKVRISAPKIEGYTVGALYCNHSYGIRADFLPTTQIGTKFQNSVELKFKKGKEEFPVIPLIVPKALYDVGITEVMDYLLIFVSETPEFKISNFEQDGVKFDIDRSYDKEKSRTDFEEDDEGEKELKKDRWSTFLIPIRVIRPQKEITISGGSKSASEEEDNSVDFAGLNLAPPSGFSATIHPTNMASAGRRAEVLKREGKSTREILPPPGFWSGQEGAETVFKRSLATAPNIHLNILELTNKKGHLSDEQPLVITPGDPLEKDEAILSVAYDNENDIYLPVGYTDQDGKVLITQLPKETPEIIGPDGFMSDESAKSVGGSIKLFFKKVVWSKLSGRHEYHKLTLIKPNGQSLQRIEYRGRSETERKELEKELIKANGKEILLLTHGITGDTNDMVEAIFERTDLHQRFGVVLAFDYENLYSELQNTAQDLGNMLAECGLKNKQLSIVSHSMGGLLARYWIEQEGGDQLVRKLVQFGTPNGGAELADFRNKLFGWLTLGLNGLDFVQKHKPLLSFIGRMIETPLCRTLHQISPDSDFITTLNDSSTKPDVLYHLIAGNTTEIEAIFDDKDPIWKKLKACLRDRGKYIFADYLFFDDERNDMVVKQESMKKLPWLFDEIAEPKSDHLRYFENAESLAALKRFLK